MVNKQKPFFTFSNIRYYKGAFYKCCLRQFIIEISDDFWKCQNLLLKRDSYILNILFILATHHLFSHLLKTTQIFV